jgi:hypothetical protein
MIPIDVYHWKWAFGKIESSANCSHWKGNVISVSNMIDGILQSFARYSLPKRTYTFQELLHGL